jgi:hypothetical protein
VGFSNSFIATKGVAKERLLEQLGLVETDVVGDVDIALSGFGLSERPGGWLLMACKDFEFPHKAPLAVISESGEVVCAAIEEHVMVSEATAFSGGHRTWRVQHDPERGIYDLQVEGDPPAVFATLREEMFAQQDREGGEKADVDLIFDIPPKLAAGLCGFEFGTSEGEFVQLVKARKPKTRAGPAEPGKPGFFARLLGRG